MDRRDFSLPFYDAEITFLLDHIRNMLPREAEITHFVLQKISSGTATPEELNEEFRKFNPK